MPNDDSPTTANAVPPAPPRARLFGVLQTVLTVAAVLAVVYILSVGAIPAGLTLGQLVVGFVALSVAVEATRWLTLGPRREAQRAFTRAIGEYGGGVYGTAALATFAWLNITDVIDDIAAAGSFAAYVDAMSFSWLIGEGVEALVFAVQALIWPWYWFNAHGPLVALVVMATVLAVDVIRKPVARWARGAATHEAPDSTS